MAQRNLTVLVRAAMKRINDEDQLEALALENEALKKEKNSLIFALELKSADFDYQAEMVKEMQMGIDTLKGRLKLSPPLRTIIMSSSSSSPNGGTLSLGDWVRTPGSSVTLPSSGVPVFDRTPVHSLGKPPRPTKTAGKGKLVKSILSLNLTDDGSGAMLGNDKGAVATQELTSRWHVDEAIPYYAMDIMNQKRMYCGSGHLSSDGEQVICQFILHFKEQSEGNIRLESSTAKDSI